MQLPQLLSHPSAYASKFLHTSSLEEVGLKSIPFGVSSFDDVPGLLRVHRLSASYASGGSSPVMALRQVDLTVAQGEVVGILGESGCGKSTLARSILGLLPADSKIEGSILFRDEELLGLPQKRMRGIRGAGIALIHQEPGLALSPVMRVGDQIAEVILAHRNLTRKARKLEVESILREVQLADVARIYAAYPHQLSGGELHRVAIAQALTCRPDLIIADEPTRSLDGAVQAEILGVLRNLNQTFGTALLFITHNPALLAGFADRVAVMYAGRVIENGGGSRVFGRPLHPYTKGLLDLVPRSSRAVYSAAGGRLPAIPGGPPDLKSSHHGCAFDRDVLEEQRFVALRIQRSSHRKPVIG
jgi:oligopeptide/dipeptide ABC transporter ATP-binding protein